MDQKNTIVKCAKHKCLFNHCGTCDQYVINIGADGSCQEYVETEVVTIRPVLCEHCGHYEDHGLLQNPCNKHKCYRYRKENACIDFIAIRGQRVKGNLLEDSMVDSKIVDEVCQPFKMKIAELNKPNKNKSTIRNVVPECDLPVCDWSCKHALRSGPSFNPDLWCDLYKMNPAMGLFCSLKEEEEK